MFDVLNGLRTVLGVHRQINRRRLFSYGGSQGGHIALLGAIFAPNTFGFVYGASPLVHLNEEPQRSWAGRGFAPWELSVRDVAAHADAIKCPVVLEHGTADDLLSCEAHTRRLAEKLTSLGRNVKVTYYEGGGHGLGPVTDRLETFKQTAPEYLRKATTEGWDDFLEGRAVEIACGERRLVIDWGRDCDSVDLFAWR